MNVLRLFCCSLFSYLYELLKNRKAMPRAVWGEAVDKACRQLLEKHGNSDLQLIADELQALDDTWKYTKDQVHSHISTIRKNDSSGQSAPRGRPSKKRKSLDSEVNGTWFSLVMFLTFLVYTSFF